MRAGNNWDNDAEAGMLLPEVLVGLAILALATITMLRVFSGAMTAIREVEETRARMNVAENLLARIVADGRALPEVQSGIADGLAWTVESQPLGEAKPGARFMPYHVSVSVGPNKPPLLVSVIFGTGQ